MAISDSDLALALDAVIEHEGSDRTASPDGMDQERWLDVVLELLERRWVCAQHRLGGDGRLVSVRGLRPTSLGRSALAQIGRRAIQEGAPGSIGLSLDEKKRRRGELMASLYDFSGGLELQTVSLNQLSERLGWAVEDTNATLEYLEHEGLVSFWGYGPEIGITHRGVIEVERAIERPAEPTEHFAPHTVVIVHGDMQGSAIQAGTVASNQSQRATFGAQREEIEAFTQLLGQALDAVRLSDDERRVAQAELVLVEAQLALPEPNEGVLRELLRSLRSIAESIAASGMFVGLVELAAKIHM